MNPIKITLTNSSKMDHVPLAALGYALRRSGVLASLDDVVMPMKTIQHTPHDKLIEALVLVLAGGRATNAIDLILRPNIGLAQAWGQAQFAQQSTVADTLDALTPESLGSLRTSFETMTRAWSFTGRHDFRRGDLIFDGDLTGLPASRHAEGSTKGYFAGKKTAMGGKTRGSRSCRIRKRSARCCIPVRKMA